MPNILLIWNRLGDYHRARSNALAAAWDQGNVYTADLGNADRLYSWAATMEQDQHFRLSAHSVEHFDFFRRIIRFLRIVRSHRIRVLGVAGYGRPEYLAMLLLGRLLGCRIILFAESWYPGSKWFDAIKGFFLRLLVHSFFVSGSRAEQYFTGRLGIPATRIRTGYSVVDTHHFMGSRVHEFMSSSVDRVDGDITQDSRLSGITPSPLLPFSPSPHQPYLLCVARYSPEKNLPMLIGAFRQSSLYGRWKLALIGNGPQREELIQLVDEDLDKSIFLTGWIGYDELPAWYHHARAFILPSTFEPWGLAVNEAMASGLPVLVSSTCGSAPDLVDDDNGWAFDPESENELVGILNIIGDLPVEWLREMGEHSRKKVNGLSVQEWSSKFIGLVK